MKGEALFATFHSTKSCNISFAVCVFVLQCVMPNIQLFMCCLYSVSYRYSNPAVPVYVCYADVSMPSSGRLLPVCDKDGFADAR